MAMKAREGDLIRTHNNIVFDVKGLVHPPGKVVAFPRFIPQEGGTRKDQQATYGKVYSLNDRFEYLQQNHPELIVYDEVFGETLCQVPLTEIAKHYQPIEKLDELRKAKTRLPIEEKALQLAEQLGEKTGIPWDSIGISGSIMAGLTTQTSDIDPIVYGEANSRKAYAALQELRKEEDSGFRPYTQEELRVLYDFRFRDTQMQFEDFERVESRKAFQGMFRGVEYFVRFVKDWAEVPQVYGEVTYQNSGYCKILTNAIDTTEALFTPCTYGVGAVVMLQGPRLSPIETITSFRGRFCLQAAVGEHIEAQGKVELVTDKKSGRQHYRLILGNKPQDYMVLT